MGHPTERQQVNRLRQIAGVLSLDETERYVATHHIARAAFRAWVTVKDMSPEQLEALEPGSLKVVQEQYMVKLEAFSSLVNFAIAKRELRKWVRTKS